MAIYKARVRRETDGQYVAAAVSLPHCWSRGATREEALEKLRDEIRYRIEFCPCTGVDDEFVRVEVAVGETTERRPVGTIVRPGAPPVDVAPAPARDWAARARGGPVVPATLSGIAGCPRDAASMLPLASATEAPGALGGRGWRRWDD